MVRQEGGRWDVGAKNNAVYLERISENDERLFDDVLAPEEARELAGLLTKYADKLGKSDSASEDSEKSDDSDDSGSEDSEKSDDSDGSDSDDSDDSDSEDSEKSDDSDSEDSDSEDSEKSGGP